MSDSLQLLTIGAGNMASALLRPMAGNLDEFAAYTPSGTKAKKLASLMGGRWVSSFEDLNNGDLKDFIPSYLFLAFKPQQFDVASKEIITQPFWDRFKEHTVVVSMLAGTPLEVLSKRFATEKVVRIMPNTPAVVGKGITLVCPGDKVGNESLEGLKFLLEQAGPTFLCKDEEQLDSVTSITGSGPAYVFEVTRIFQDFLTSKGLTKKEARELAVGLLVGASELMESEDTDLELLRNNVTSKKGVTEAALNSLKEANLESIFNTALEKNIERSFELRGDALKMKD
jgi:pyrroline-5-carboxylate reductase